MILTDPEWQAVILSLKVSSPAVLFSLPFGIFFARLLVRCKFPGKALLDSVLHLPLVLPPGGGGVSAVGLYGAARIHWRMAVRLVWHHFAFSWRGRCWPLR